MSSLKAVAPKFPCAKEAAGKLAINEDSQVPPLFSIWQSAF
jgi:hypothetical protein